MKKPASLGTTLIAVKYDGGVLMGTDTLVTRGSYIFARNAKKIIELSPSPKTFGSIKVITSGVVAHF